MAPLAPFGPAPHLAVGVSGGPDSLALALLAGAWAAAQGGRVTALTVDHGLRPESAGEARQVAAWMAGAGLDHVTLRWVGPRPAHGLQAAARMARLALMEAWCRAHGVLDLLLAHHAGDQAETVLQRLGQGSGPDGLAGMARVSWRRCVRVLRPVLDQPAGRTRATLAARGHPWIEDPSNADTVFQRVRLRHLAPSLAEAGVSAPGLVLSAARAAEAREERRRRRDARLAATVTFDGLGAAHVNMARLLDGPPSEVRAALGRLLACVGGSERPPRGQPLERLRRRLSEAGPPRGLTLGRCRLLPGADGTWRVCREDRNLPDPMPLPGPEAPPLLWDGRLLVRVAGDGPDPGWALAPLGADGWLDVTRALREIGAEPPTVPVAVRPGLLALISPDGMVSAVPQIGYPVRPVRGLPRLDVERAPGTSLTEGPCRLYGAGDGLSDEEP
nr:tRNA lysidine(34) synthetase TilS [Roseospira navarrensis]